MYKLSTLRKKADKIGFHIEKGLQHYIVNGAVFHDNCGDRKIGYEVLDFSSGHYVYGCYNELFDHLWTLEDVERFLKDQYKSLGLEF